MFSSEFIENWPGFLSLKAEWNGLLSRSRADTVFLTWEWIRSWSEVVGESVRPFIISVRDNNGSLLGLAPFYLSELSLLGLLPYRALRIMADYATGLDYADWIIRKDCEVEVSHAITKALAEYKKYWDCIWMPNVAGWTGARERILRPCGEQGFFSHERSRDFGVFDLPEDMKKYFQSLSRNRRSQLRRQIKKVLGRNDIRFLRCLTADDLPRFLDALFELHYRRRNKLGDEGTFRRKPDQVIFYRSFTKAAFKKGWLWFFGLEDHGEFKAIQIGYVYNNVFHQLQEGFDPDYIDGVGNVLRTRVIEACIAEGIKAYDFLGDMTEHKRRWGAKLRTGYDFFISHKSLKNRILFTREVWPTGRFLRPQNQ